MSTRGFQRDLRRGDPVAAILDEHAGAFDRLASRAFPALEDDSLWKMAFRRLSEATGTSDEVRSSYRIVESNDNLTIEVDLPGVQPADVKVTYRDQQVDVTYAQNGRQATRSFTVSESFDVTACQASLSLGVLKLQLPPAPLRAAPRSIEVKVG